MQFHQKEKGTCRPRTQKKSKIVYQIIYSHTNNWNSSINFFGLTLMNNKVDKYSLFCFWEENKVIKTGSPTKKNILSEKGKEGRRDMRVWLKNVHCLSLVICNDRERKRSSLNSVCLSVCSSCTCENKIMWFFHTRGIQRVEHFHNRLIFLIYPKNHTSFLDWFYNFRHFTLRIF